MNSFNKVFARFASRTSCIMGRPWVFLLATLSVIVWAASGPFFGFSDTWELIINTATTIVTFLMVFLIQHTQNRDTVALHLKLDEVIRAIDEARNDFIDIDQLDDDELRKLRVEFQRLRESAKLSRRERESAAEMGT